MLNSGLACLLRGFVGVDEAVAEGCSTCGMPRFCFHWSHLALPTSADASYRPHQLHAAALKTAVALVAAVLQGAVGLRYQASAVLPVLLKGADRSTCRLHACLNLGCSLPYRTQAVECLELPLYLLMLAWTSVVFLSVWLCSASMPTQMEPLIRS